LSKVVLAISITIVLIDKLPKLSYDALNEYIQNEDICYKSLEILLIEFEDNPSTKTDTVKKYVKELVSIYSEMNKARNNVRFTIFDYFENYTPIERIAKNWIHDKHQYILYN
jgi:hypothetical protein